MFTLKFQGQLSILVFPECVELRSMFTLKFQGQLSILVFPECV